MFRRVVDGMIVGGSVGCWLAVAWLGVWWLTDRLVAWLGVTGVVVWPMVAGAVFAGLFAAHEYVEEAVR